MKDYPKREIELFKILDGRTETIETVPAKYQDLTFQKLFGYYGSKGIVLNQKTFIKNLGLKTEEGEFNILSFVRPWRLLSVLFASLFHQFHLVVASSTGS